MEVRSAIVRLSLGTGPTTFHTDEPNRSCALRVCVGGGGLLGLRWTLSLFLVTICGYHLPGLLVASL